jgi:hypothetical protein
MTSEHSVAKALAHALISPNVSDSNFEAANLVDTTDRIASALYAISKQLARIADAMERRPNHPPAAAGADPEGPNGSTAPLCPDGYTPPPRPMGPAQPRRPR